MTINAELLAPVLVALLGGGLITAAVSVYTARKRVPAEADNLIVTGAESAVTSLTSSLEAETRRADRAEKRVVELATELDQKQQRIEALEARLDALQVSLDEARAELHRIITNP